MNYLGVTYSIGAKPELDPGFIPFGVWMDAYLKDAKKPIAIAIERDRGQVSVRKTFMVLSASDIEMGFPFTEKESRFISMAVTSLIGYAVTVSPSIT